MTTEVNFGIKKSMQELFLLSPHHLLFIVMFSYRLSEPGHEKMCLMSYANNKGADQPAHPRSLIRDFVFAA